MKNTVLFIILVVLTIAALLAWNVVDTRKALPSNDVGAGTPTPTAELGGLREFFGRLSNKPTSTPTPTITVGVTPTVELSKGGIPLATDVSQTPQPTPRAEVLSVSQERKVITYTESGFTPSRITIKKGESIIFVNAVSQHMWIMGDDHPSHQKLQGFGMSSSVGKDGIYEYRFATSGEWGFHNETSQNQQGSIIVE